MARPPTRALTRRAFAQTVRTLRLRIGKSQEQLALEAGVDRGYMGALERGRHSPTLETVYKLLGPLGVSLTEFAGEFERVLASLRRQAAG